MDYRLSKHGDALTALADIGGGVSKSARKKSPKTIFTITFSRFRFGKFNRKGVLFLRFNYGFRFGVAFSMRS